MRLAVYLADLTVPNRPRLGCPGFPGSGLLFGVNPAANGPGAVLSRLANSF